jgi:hypothetical protein
MMTALSLAIICMVTRVNCRGAQHIPKSSLEPSRTVAELTHRVRSGDIRLDTPAGWERSSWGLAAGG